MHFAQMNEPSSWVDAWSDTLNEQRIASYASFYGANSGVRHAMIPAWVVPRSWWLANQQQEQRSTEFWRTIAHISRQIKDVPTKSHPYGEFSSGLAGKTADTLVVDDIETGSEDFSKVESKAFQKILLGSTKKKHYTRAIADAVMALGWLVLERDLSKAEEISDWLLSAESSYNVERYHDTKDYLKNFYLALSE